MLKEQSQSLRLLIVGAGPVVEYFHLPALRHLGWITGSLAVDIANESLVRLTHLQRELQVLNADYREILDDRNLSSHFDAALIALPNALHVAAVKACLESGLHVLCEKPLALTQIECMQLAALARERRRVLSVAMAMRYLPGLTAMRQFLAEGRLGQIISVDVEDGNPFAWSSESGAYFAVENGGVLPNIGVHYLDLVGSLFGPLEPVRYEDDKCGGVEANFTFTLRAESVQVRIECSYTRKLRNSVVVQGEKGELVLRKVDPEACYWIQNGLSARIVKRVPFRYGAWQPTLEACFAEQLAHFQATIRGDQIAPVSADDAAPVAGCMEWAGQRRVECPDIGVWRTESSAQAPLGQVVVTGGTGFVGSHLVEALARLGFRDIVVPTRSFRSGANVGRFPVRFVKGDLLDRDFVRRTIRGARYVFHLAYGADGPDAGRATTDGACNVCEISAEQRVESVVLVGTTAAYAEPNVIAQVDETSPYRKKGSPYEMAKVRMAERVLRLSRGIEHTRVVLLEPACIYGPGCRPFTELPVNLAAAGSFAWVDAGEGVVNYTYVDNFVDALICAATHKGVHGQKFIIVDGNTTWREFLEPLIGESAGSIASLTSQQLRLLNANLHRAGLSDAIHALLRSEEFLGAIRTWPAAVQARRLIESLFPQQIRHYRDIRNRPVDRISTAEKTPKSGTPPAWLETLYGSSSARFTAEKARRTLGWQPRLNLHDGSSRSIAWLRYSRIP